VTITHPYHPLYGQQVEIIRVRRGRDPDLVVRLPDGHHAAIAMSWTSSSPPAPLEAPPITPHLLDLNGLRQIVQLLEHIRNEGRYPPSGRGAIDPPTNSG
jgi:hypothetical protein